MELKKGILQYGVKDILPPGSKYMTVRLDLINPVVGTSVLTFGIAIYNAIERMD